MESKIKPHHDTAQHTHFGIVYASIYRFLCHYCFYNDTRSLHRTQLRCRTEASYPKVVCWPAASQNAFPWNVRWFSDSYQSHNWLHTTKRRFYNRCCRTFLPLVGTTTIKRHFGSKQPLRCSLRSAPRHAALSLRSGRATPATQFGTRLVPHQHPDYLF